jgi:DNA repair exonuclease SbcCD ATPase subunit
MAENEPDVMRQV